MWLDFNHSIDILDGIEAVDLVMMYKGTKNTCYRYTRELIGVEFISKTTTQARSLKRGARSTDH